MAEVGKAKRHSNRTTRRIRVAVGLLLVLLISFLVVLEGRVPKALLEARLSGALGGDLRIGELRWIGWGRIGIRGVSLQVPGWQKDAAEVASISRAEVSFLPWRLMFGHITLEELVIEGVRINLVEDAQESGRLNVQSLRWRTVESSRTDAAGEPSLSVEKLVLQDAVVQMSVLQGTTVIRQGELPLEGYAEEKPDGRTSISLSSPGRPARVEGWMDQRRLAFELSLRDLAWEPGFLGLLPAASRAIARELDLDGTIPLAQIGWHPGNRFTARLELKDVQVTTPDVGLGEEWVRLEGPRLTRAMGNPRIRIRSGIASVDGARVKVEKLAGAIGSSSTDGAVVELPIDAEVSIDFTEADPSLFAWESRDTWLRRALLISPLSLHLRIPAFEAPGEGRTAAIELPRAAGDFLRRFAIRDWSIDLDAVASRDAPVRQPDGSLGAAAIRTKATMLINRGEGEFQAFPYPLTQVQARLSFDGDVAKIDYLRGKGSEGANILIIGSIDNIGDAARIDLTVSSDDAPVDASLFKALPPPTRVIFDTIFDRRAGDSLRLAGITKSPAQVARAKERVVELVKEIDETARNPRSDPRRVARLAEECGAWRRVVDEGAFEVGGRGGFSLRITRPPQADHEVAVAGYIDIHSASVLLKPFPLPLRIIRGTIGISDEWIEFGQAGLHVQTIDGAEGLVTGRIDIPHRERGRAFLPEINFAVQGARINERLVHAIPGGAGVSEPGWPGGGTSAGGKILRDCGVTGQGNFEGRIFADPAGEVRFSVRATVRDAYVAPLPQLLHSFGATGLFWPEGFALSGCSVDLKVDSDGVYLDSFKGFRRGGAITAAAYSDFASGAWLISADLANLELGEYLVNIAPQEGRAAADALWKRWNPQGTFDAHLACTGLGASAAPRLEIQPHVINFNLPTGSVIMTPTGGLIAIEDTHATADGFTCRIGKPGAAEPASLCLDGSYGFPTKELSLSGAIVGGALESPALRETLVRLGADRAVELYDQLEPSGTYDAEFESVTGLNPGFHLIATPHSLILGAGGEPFAATFATGSHIHIENDLITLGSLDGVFNGGEFSASGWIQGTTVDPAIDMELALTTTGPSRSLLSALPTAVRGVVESIDLTWADRLEISALRLSGPGDGAPLSVDGSVDILGGALNAGVRVTDIDASTSFAATIGGGTSSLTMNAFASAMDGDGRPISDATCTLTKLPEDNLLTVDGPNGAIGTGRVSVAAVLDLGDRHPFMVDVAVSDAPIGLCFPGFSGGDAAAGTVDARVWYERCDDPKGAIVDEGRGRLSVHDATLSRSSFLLAFAQVAQLMLPTGGAIRNGSTDFSIHNRTLRFDSLSLTNDSMRLFGEGEMSLDSGQLALRLRSRGTVPLLSDVVGSLSDALYQLDVSGTLRDPKVSLTPLPGLGAEPSISGSGAKSEPEA